MSDRIEKIKDLIKSGRVSLPEARQVPSAQPRTQGVGSPQGQMQKASASGFGSTGFGGRGFTGIGGGGLSSSFQRGRGYGALQKPRSNYTPSQPTTRQQPLYKGKGISWSSQPVYAAGGNDRNVHIYNELQVPHGIRNTPARAQGNDAWSRAQNRRRQDAMKRRQDDMLPGDLQMKIVNGRPTYTYVGTARPKPKPRYNSVWDM